ncbi:MAG: glycosyltransferase [Candidatus Hydrogenedentes bacterium]|nr:glycosyltransferase [Candidatus Hydrogenedentota bacterium]
MTTPALRIAIDASCAMETPMTGVGYAALNLLRALCRSPHGFDLRLFGTPDRSTQNALDDLRPHFSTWYIRQNARQLKYFLWPSLNWPPIEWFCGGVDIAHNLFHQLPAARNARRIVTIHDLSFLFMPEVHTKHNVQKQTRLVRHGARHADAIVAVSEQCRHEIIDTLGVPEDRVYVVRNAVDHTEFAGALDTPRTESLKKQLGLTHEYLIHLGTLEPRKNIPQLLRAYNRLRAKIADCPQLLLVGKRGWLYSKPWLRVRR